MCEVKGVECQPCLAGIDLWYEASKQRCSSIESEIGLQSREHIKEAEANCQTIACRCTGFFCCLMHHHPDMNSLHLKERFGTHEEFS